MSASYPPTRILAAFDASGPGRAALRAAAGLARACGAALEVFYAESPPVTMPYDLDALDTGAARALERENVRFRAQWEREARELSEGVGRVELTWIRGWPVDLALELIRRRGADLLVAGTHGRSGMERLFLGSVAEQLVRRSPVPVLCVHEADALRGPVLAPYNLTTPAEAALAYALDLSRAGKRPLTALYVSGADEPGAREHLQAALALEAGASGRGGRGITPLVRRGEALDQIAREARRGRYGLVVLSSHVKPTLSERALGSMAERLLRKARVAVLAVPVSVPPPPRRAAGRRRASASPRRSPWTARKTRSR